MAHRYHEIAFTDAVRAAQEALGSREDYARMAQGPERGRRLGPREAEFVAARDSLVLATVSETGWPYVQHRGGPPGFVTVLDPETLAMPDFAGNRQYVTLGNIRGNDRASLLLMDFAARRRLKVLGRLTEAPAGAAPAPRGAAVERALILKVEAFDWNCPKHIPPRYTAEEIEGLVAPLRARLAELEARLAGSEG